MTVRRWAKEKEGLQCLVKLHSLKWEQNKKTSLVTYIPVLQLRVWVRPLGQAFPPHFSFCAISIVLVCRDTPQPWHLLQAVHVHAQLTGQHCVLHKTRLYRCGLLAEGHLLPLQLECALIFLFWVTCPPPHVFEQLPNVAHWWRTQSRSGLQPPPPSHHDSERPIKVHKAAETRRTIKESFFMLLTNDQSVSFDGKILTDLCLRTVQGTIKDRFHCHVIKT